MKLGYARVSTDDQTLNLQLDALAKAGCERIFKDVISGAKDVRPGLDQALAALRSGDTLVVWKLDRLGRNLKGLIDLMNEFATKGVGFQSLTEQIDTTTPGGKLIFHVFAALAEFERDLIRERTNAGLSASRARGKIGGRPRVEALNSPKKLALAQALYQDERNSIGDICRTVGVSKATLYRYLKASGTLTPRPTE
jgi:DNA invertase Pin-like site-specific DNA recombinase